MIIKNKAELSTTSLRRKALDIIEAGIARVLASTVMKYAVKYDPERRVLAVNDHAYDLSRGRLFVIGGGKAAGLMAETLEQILTPDNITAGVVNCTSSDYTTSKIKIVKAGHPVPDQQGVNGVKQMLELKECYSINEDDLIICLISGGGSALMPCPVDEVNLDEKQRVTELLLRSGAAIHEINTVRKHLSKTKGGGLGQFYSPATVVSLILSDVIGNDLDIIASGQTCPDTSTFADACNVLERYTLSAKAPGSVVGFLKKSCQVRAAEKPLTLDNCRNHIIGDNTMALNAMMEKAVETGLTPYIVTAEQKGDTTAVARLRAGEILGGKYSGYNVVLIGGETTPSLPDNAGRGGRNQHYATITMLVMKEYPREWVVASVGTDGTDFLPDVAGAIVDDKSLGKAMDSGIAVESYVERYDSNTLLQKMGDSLVVTGNTGTNVGDIIVYVLK